MVGTAKTMVPGTFWLLGPLAAIPELLLGPVGPFMGPAAFSCSERSVIILATGFWGGRGMASYDGARSLGYACYWGRGDVQPQISMCPASVVTNTQLSRGPRESILHLDGERLGLFSQCRARMTGRLSKRLASTYTPTHWS